MGRIHGIVALAWLVAATSGILLPPAPDPTVGSHVLGQPLLIDFFSYWSGYRVFRSGLDPYDTRNSSAAFGFTVPRNRAPNNPPWLFFLMAPVLNLPLVPASLLWLAVNVSAAIGITLWIWRGLLFAARPPPNAAAAMLASVLAVPVVIGMHYGQSAMLLVTASTGAMIALAQGRYFWAGAWLAICTLKPHLFLLPGLMLLYEMWLTPRARWAIAGGATGLAAIVAIPFALNPAAFWQWLGLSSKVGLLDWQTSCIQTWIRLGIRALGGDDPEWICWLFPASAALATAAFLVTRRPAIPWSLAFPPALAMSLICAPYHWTYDQSLTLPLQIQLLGATVDPGTRADDRRSILVAVALLFALAYAMKIALPNEMYFFWYPIALLALWLRYHRCFPARWRDG